jgi:hypothetical protein
LALLITGK